MTPHPLPRRAVRIPTSIGGPIRRSAAVGLAVLVIGSTPLVAHALGEDDSSGGAQVVEATFELLPTDTPAPPSLGAEIQAVAEVIAAPVTRPSITAIEHAQVTERAQRGAATAVESPIDVAPTPAPPMGTSLDQWAALRDCESGGDYSITNPSGKYRGAYQFDRTTWDSVAGRHDAALVGIDPAAASPTDQDTMAYALYTERGSQPWPHCGRHLR